MIFVQCQQAGDMVDLAAGQHHRSKRAVPRPTAGMELRRDVDLLAQIGRCVDQYPTLAVRGGRDRRLRSRQSERIAGPRPPEAPSLLFHCGNPPPAADPRTTTRNTARLAS